MCATAQGNLPELLSAQFAPKCPCAVPKLPLPPLSDGNFRVAISVIGTQGFVAHEPCVETINY